MRTTDKSSRAPATRPRRKAERAITPKDIAADIAERPLDRLKVKRESRRAVQAADRLLREMDDVLKHLQRKR